MTTETQTAPEETKTVNEQPAPQAESEQAPTTEAEQPAEQNEPEEKEEKPMSFTDAIDALTSVYLSKLLQLEKAYGARNSVIDFEAVTNCERIFNIKVTARSNKASKDSKENRMTTATKKPAAKKTVKKTVKKAVKKPAVKKASKKVPAKKKAVKKVAKKK